MFFFQLFYFFNFCELRSGMGLWLVKVSIWMTPSALSHHALETAECDESYCNDRGTLFGRRGCGKLFYHDSYCDESVIMTIYGFFLGDVSFGGGLWPYMAYGRGIPIYGGATTPQVSRVTKMCLTLLLTSPETECWWIFR
jgi:hypothetical protein